MSGLYYVICDMRITINWEVRQCLKRRLARKHDTLSPHAIRTQGCALEIFELIYASRPFGFDNLTLYDILMTARRNNTRDEITGALICREDLYVQLLEGGREAVTAAYTRILRDGRHTAVRELSSRHKTARLFPEWAMRDDPMQSWMWTFQEVNGGAVERATAAAAQDIFVRLSQQPHAPIVNGGQQ